MDSIYTASYRCKSIEPVGFPGYVNVVLGLPGHVMSNSDVVIHATCSRFEIGKEYLIVVYEL